MTRAWRCRARQSGFTLLEVALAVGALGLLLTTALVGRGSAGASVSEEALLDGATVHLVRFAARNNRLPCPDLNGDGFEDVSAGVCAANIKSGGVPYHTIGMILPAPVGTGVDRQFVYSVYRGDGVAASDLTVNVERSPSGTAAHTAASASYANLDDFRQALIGNLGRPLSDTEVHVTGNDADAGVANCASNRVANVAFLVAYAGPRNADSTGSSFDGENLPSAGWASADRWQSAKARTCFTGPGKPSGPLYDDEVRAFSFVELLGLLNR